MSDTLMQRHRKTITAPFVPVTPVVIYADAAAVDTVAALKKGLTDAGRY